MSFYQGKMTMDSGIGSMFKKKYCEGGKTICARYIVATTLGPNFVPDTLFPNMNDRAKAILAENGK